MGVSLGVFAFNVKLGAIFSSYHDVSLGLFISQGKREKNKVNLFTTLVEFKD